MKSILVRLGFSEVLLRKVIFMEASLVKDIFSLADIVLKIQSIANIKKYKFDIKIQMSRTGNTRLRVPYDNHSLELSSICTLCTGLIFLILSQATTF